MVIEFESSDGRTIFMGVDKHENEYLIQWGWPEDVWFHVDKMSSAHVYLRLRKGETLEDVSAQLVEECAQLVKANSIQGNKMNNIDVVYTMWDNLHKTANMEVGQVGFKSQKEVRKVRVERRLNEVVNRLNKTRREREADYRLEREERDRLEQEDKKQQQRLQRKADETEQRRKEEERQLRSYDSMLAEDKMTSNKCDDGNDSDDFM